LRVLFSPCDDDAATSAWGEWKPRRGESTNHKPRVFCTTCPFSGVYTGHVPTTYMAAARGVRSLSRSLEFHSVPGTNTLSLSLTVGLLYEPSQFPDSIPFPHVYTFPYPRPPAPFFFLPSSPWLTVKGNRRSKRRAITVP
jgi:hypothetical protein